jgi:hypothetical protein
MVRGASIETRAIDDVVQALAALESLHLERDFSCAPGRRRFALNTRPLCAALLHARAAIASDIDDAAALAVAG